MESVFQKIFHKNRRRLFCRRSRRPSSVIELPISKEIEKDTQEVAVVVSRPPPDVRLVLFRECGDTSDRKLLFDSKTVEPDRTEERQQDAFPFSTNSLPNISINNNKLPNGSCRSSVNYQYVRGPHDADILSEMLFGSVGMASRASSLKIHIIKEPPQLMLSRVFCLESNTTVSLDRGMEYHLQNNRNNSVLSRRKAKTLPMPTPEVIRPQPMSIASSLTSRLTRSDSSSSLMSLTSMLGASLQNATGSLGSRSLPQSVPANVRAHSLPPIRQPSRDSFTLNSECTGGVTSRRTKVKIGFAVLFQPEPSNSSEFQNFFFEHFPLIESYVTLLKEKVESALNNCKRTRNPNSEFIQAMMEALHVLSLRVTSIYSTPRLPKPVWSSLTTSAPMKMPWSGDRVTVECFIADLTRMVNQHNTKNKNFFMSSLITAVLSNHLGWVSTAMPPSGENETINYNPLWAQLGDLYGAVGTPTKVAKTVVIGEIHELVSTILSILSYFIRCSNISEVVSVPEKITPSTVFDRTDNQLEISYVPSDLESDYVFVSVKNMMENQQSMTESINQNAKLNKREEKSVLSHFCRKLKNTEKVVSTSPGSTLSRSKSSPGSTEKPQPKVTRQISNRQTSTEIVQPIRRRTNSNDCFKRPRGVQSRRTSYEVSNVRRMSQSSSALVIPDSNERSPMEVRSSLEGSKSLCGNHHGNFEPELVMRLANDNSGSCPEDKQLRQSIKRPVLNTSFSLKPRSYQREKKTHKRVSSEPFSINLPSICQENSMVWKSKSTYFHPPVVEQTFVDRTEPKLVHVAHVQRSAVVSSPQFPRSTMNNSKNDPIIGFETPEMKRKQKNIVEKNEFGMEILPKGELKSPSGVRRSSSSNSGKIRLATRRRKLTGDSMNRSFDESDQELDKLNNIAPNLVLKLPPLMRIPSVSLNHEDFDEYFAPGDRENLNNPSGIQEEDKERDEYIFFKTKAPSKPDSSDANTVPKCLPSSMEPDTMLECPLDSLGKHPVKYQPTSSLDMTVSTEKPNSISNSHLHPATDISPSPIKNVHGSLDDPSKQSHFKKLHVSGPPPLPSVAPCHSQLPFANEKKETMVLAKASAVPKLPPPLPTSPPVHKGSLYPSLEQHGPHSKHLKQTLSVPSDLKISAVQGLEVGTESLYPSLKDCSLSLCNENTVVNTKPLKDLKTDLKIYPDLEEVDKLNYVSTDSSNLYPRLPKSNGDIRFESPARLDPNLCDDKRTFEEENLGREEIPLAPVKYQEEKSGSDKKPHPKDVVNQQSLTFAELLADYSPEYLWGFALHGTCNQQGLHANIIGELQHSVAHPVLDEPVAESVCILADTDRWTVQVLSSHRIHSDRTALPALTSKLVTTILERISKLYMMKVPASFCMQQLESELAELVLKSRMLAGYLKGNTRVTVSQLSAVLGIESKDLPLLMAIASCHNPHVAAILL